jgi:hypothetical protein
MLLYPVKITVGKYKVNRISLYVFLNGITPELTTEFLMFRTFRFLFCIFLTSSFNSAWADFCFDNTNQNGVMAKQICFKEIRILKAGTPDHKLYLKSRDIDEIYAIKKIESAQNGYVLSVNGDYINYSENCGLTVLSQFDFRFFVNSQYQYVHDKNTLLDVKYKYTPNNCTVKEKAGTEKFTAKNPVN